MSLLFSRQCEYAIQALIYLAKHKQLKWITIKQIAEHLKIPQHFLSKIMLVLVNKKLVKSSKGLHGGFAFNISPEKISLFDIVEAIDGDSYRNQCIIGFPDCSHENPCPVHDQWKTLREGFVEMIQKKNLKALADEIAKPGYDK